MLEKTLAVPESTRAAGLCPLALRSDKLIDAGALTSAMVSGSDHPVDTRLATYGTLSPGQVNHHHLSSLKGCWQSGTVNGWLTEGGWGSALGFPGLTLDPLGPTVKVYLFQSEELPDHWSRLDEFEGSGYRRVVTQVRTGEGETPAYIYVLAEDH
jgi:gamma-glutamylcyclotransferase (GGCT)/AIG2-like uncharacterized protein YtfP